MTQGNNPNKNGAQTMLGDTVNPQDNKPVENQPPVQDSPAGENKPAENQPPVQKEEKQEKPAKKSAKPMTALEQVMAQQTARQK